MATASLIGVRELSLDELRKVPCPSAEGRWVPVPHHVVVEHVLSALRDAGYAINQMRLGVSREDMRLFGTAVLAAPLVPGVSLAVGFRSSLDKSISLQWCCGSYVSVCSNLSFRSEVVISRKHTVNGVLRYQEAICRTVAGLAAYREMESAAIRYMQDRRIEDDFALATLMRLYQDEQILSPRTLPVALEQWRNPSFEEFKARNAWSLYNSVTYAIGKRSETNPQAHSRAAIRLSGLLAPPEAPQAPADDPATA